MADAEPVPISHRLLKGEVYDRLRAMIIEGELAPGQTIRDSELAQALGVSNTPVREALARLQQDGLIEAPPYKGKRVAPLSRKGSLDQIEVLRILCAALYPRGIAACDDVMARALRKEVSTMRAAVKARDRHRAAAASLAIHDAIYAAAGNERARRIGFLAQDRLERTINLIGHYSGRATSVDPTAAFVEAVIARDETDAMAILTERHDELERAVRQMPEVMGDEG